jgi:hypothetical protein
MVARMTTWRRTGLGLSRKGRCHPRRISFLSENLDDIELAALANKKCKMSPFAAAIPPGQSWARIA